ncbi:MAG: Gfo/Idh/MocA family oxidoreductase [Kiritimatiellaeota bacterium]|nr:Gfo/Idh/MocA family oxidoreductase [Kiritimatiellota bacterium]
MSTEASRRSFLKKTAFASAGLLSGPLLLPSSARGAAGHTPPSERIVLVCIGMGKMMSGHLNGLLGNDQVHIAALCDVETTRLAKCKTRVEATYSERYGKTYRGCQTTGDFRELLDRDDIDAVFLATPTNWHAAISIAAMRAGKDVYCEKPLALTVREANAVVDAQNRYRRVFQTGSQQRSDYKFRLACELVRNGLIGRIKSVHVNVGGPPAPCYLPAEPTPKTLDWDMWVGPAPMRPYHHLLCPLDDYKTWPRWRYYRNYGGGGMTDWGAHHFDIAQWALGMDGSGPIRIEPPNGKDIKRLTYTYANGTIMTHGGAREGAGVDFIGTDGWIGVNRGYLKTEPKDLVRVQWGPADIRLYESRNHVGNWLDCVRTRRRPICPAEVGCSSITVCLLGNIAYWLERPLEWDPEKKRFVNDPAADRLLFRCMRTPWIV